MARAYLLGIAEEQRQMNVLRRERRARRTLSNSNCMNLPDQEFEAHFRLSKEIFKVLSEELRPYMREQRRKTGVPHILKICDSELNILYADSSFGGAAHDSFVWNQSPVKEFIEELHNNGEDTWLPGDSGYAQRSYMMTPILGASPETPAEYYTNLHCRVRNTVERCIGVLKARWQCLLAHRVLHYNPIMSGKIVNACVVLHNIANSASILRPELSLDERDSDLQRQPTVAVPANVDSARDLLVNRLWRGR